MKKKFILRKFLIMALILAFTASAAASELRVYQLGSAWLVPDDYMDVLANPARINYIGRMIFSGTLDNYVSKYNDSGAPDHGGWAFTPKIAHMGAYGELGEGLIYKVPYTLTNTDDVETSHSLTNDLTVIFGKKFGDQFSFGVSANFQTVYNEDADPDLASAGEFKLGADYDTGAMDFGAAFGASHRFTGLDNVSVRGKLLYGMKDAGGSGIRAVNETVYKYQKLNPIIIGMASPFEGKDFGYNRVDNYTGISYITTLNSVKCIIGVENNWKIGENTFTGYAAPFNTKTEDISEVSENFLVKAGIETKIFTDWLILRTSYIPLAYTHSSRHYVKILNTVEEVNDSSIDEFTFFSGGNLSIGLGVELGKDMTIDLLINNLGIISYSRSSAFITSTLPEFWMESEGSLIVAEFTLRM